MRFSLVFKAILFTMLVPGTVILYLPYSLVSHSGGDVQMVGPNLPASVFILLGLGVYLRCTWDFMVDGLGTPAPIDPPKRLVVSGIYRWTRNPMYQGILMILLAESALFPIPGLLVYVASVALVFHSFVVLYEEPTLSTRFGESFRDYRRKVPRWGFALRPFLDNSPLS